MRTGFTRPLLLRPWVPSGGARERLGSAGFGSRLRQRRARVVVTTEEGGCRCGRSEVESERRTATRREPGKDPRGGGPGAEPGGSGRRGLRGVKAVPARARSRGGAAGLGPGLAGGTAGPPCRAFPGKQKREFVPARPRGKGAAQPRGAAPERCGSLGAQGRRGWCWSENLQLSYT